MERTFTKILLAIGLITTLQSATYAKKSASLLSSTPSENQIYTAWGHTAIRITDDETGMDIVFNYGVFNFNDLGKFIYRFVTGETDYMLGLESMERAKRSANLKKCTLYEQKLNLTPEEAEKLSQALFENSLPENTYYRYNFFYCNCATKARDIIEKTCIGLKYPKFKEDLTYREIIHERLANMPWYSFGIDICLGSPTDEKVKGLDITFMPMELKKAFDQTLKTDGTPLVSTSEPIIMQQREDEEKEEESWFPSPLFAGWFFLALVVAHTIYYTRKKKNDRWFDMTLFSLSGLLGLLICFLAFISEHPCTNPNFNLLWLNPVHLIIAITLPIAKKNPKPTLVATIISAIALSIPILCWPVIPQKFNPAFLPIMLSLLLRTFTIIRRKKIQC